jgi:hypothetical protein
VVTKTGDKLIDEKVPTASAEDKEDVLAGVEWSFDLAQFGKHVAKDDDLQTVIRGHLYLEHVLINFLREALRFPDELNTDKVSFPLKVELCAAQGILPHGMVEPLRVVNALRNKSAHDLNYTVSIEEKNRLFNSCSELGRQLIVENGTQGTTHNLADISIGHMLKVLVIMADLGRQNYISWKKKRNEAFENARRIVSELDTGTASTDAR